MSEKLTEWREHAKQLIEHPTISAVLDTLDELHLIAFLLGVSLGGTVGPLFVVSTMVGLWFWHARNTDGAMAPAPGGVRKTQAMEPEEALAELRSGITGDRLDEFGVAMDLPRARVGAEGESDDSYRSRLIAFLEAYIRAGGGNA